MKGKTDQDDKIETDNDGKRKTGKYSELQDESW